MKKNVMRLLKKYDVSTIEKSLIQLFLNQNHLNPNNAFLKSYLSDFEMIEDNDIENIILKDSLTLSFENLERYFELLFPSIDKKLGGIFYTPEYIADFIVKEVIGDNPDIRILDPSCGAGIFCYISVMQLKEKFPEKSIVEIIESNIYACDIEPISTNRTKIMLILTALLHGENPTEINFNIITKDSLRRELDWKGEFPVVFEDGGFDAVVGNPPYIRIQNIPDVDKKYLHENWYSARNGNVDIYYAFIELGLELLNESGKIGFITPNSHFNTASGKNLRKLLKRKQHIQKVINFDYIRVFKDVNVYSCISIFTKSRNPYIRYYKVKEELDKIDLTEDDYKTVHYMTLDDDKIWVFLSDDEIRRIDMIENAGTKLIDFCDINVGIATLSDYIYILDDYRVEIDGKTFHIEPGVCKPIIKASTLHNEEEIKTNTLKIIWPYDSEANLIPEDVMVGKYPNAYEYLKYMKSNLNKRDRGRSNPYGWYAFGMTQSLKTSFGKKLLTSTMNLKPNFIYCDDGDSTFVNGYQVKSKFMDLRILQKILNSSVMEEYIEMTSKSYQRGWKSYAKSYIMNFGVPRFTKDQLEFLEKENDQEKINEFLEDIYFNSKKEVQSTLI